MARKFKATLSSSSIIQLKKQLEAYRDNIPSLCEEFVKELAKIGIRTGKQNCGEYGNYITFEVSDETILNKYGCKGFMVAKNERYILSTWYRGKEIAGAVVNPLLMAEFGSGFQSRVIDENVDLIDVGQGTFPGQTHAFDPEGWYWRDNEPENGIWVGYDDSNGRDIYIHHSYGESPTYPMYSAAVAIMFDVERIAKKVFGRK